MTTKQEILASLQPLLSRFNHVSINLENINSLIPHLSNINASNWTSEYVFSDGTYKSVNYLGLFSPLSFCYWPKPKWHIIYNGEELGGSYSLFYALKRAIEEGKDITDAMYLKNLSSDEFAYILRGDDGTVIPFLHERYDIAVEVGTVLADKFGGKFTNLFEEADYDASSINRLLVDNFDCFADQHELDGKMLKFFKKSQEVITLTFEQFNGQGLGAIANIEDLTASSDYKLPQSLNSLGVLVYRAPLMDLILTESVLAADSRECLEIRAATIYACEKIVEQLSSKGIKMNSSELSNALWTISQNTTLPVCPYPRINSIWV